MGTRCAINFCYGNRIEAKIYRHWDGYPDGNGGVLVDLRKFFDAVKAQTNDTRFNDPTYLAAKFLVLAIVAPKLQEDADKAAGMKKSWGEWPKRETKDRYLDFLGYGVMMSDPGDLEYFYNVDCNSFDKDGYPVVTYRSVYANR